jgi:hypothetical protein
VIGGYERPEGVPDSVSFTPSSVPDAKFEWTVAGSSKGAAWEICVKPFCMGFEDFYVAFAEGSHPALSASPNAGRMDRRGGEETVIEVSCVPGGKSGVFAGDLVMVLPEENEKLTYKIEVTAF